MSGEVANVVILLSRDDLFPTRAVRSRHQCRHHTQSLSRHISASPLCRVRSARSLSFLCNRSASQAEFCRRRSARLSAADSDSAADRGGG